MMVEGSLVDDCQPFGRCNCSSAEMYAGWAGGWSFFKQVKKVGLVADVLKVQYS